MLGFLQIAVWHMAILPEQSDASGPNGQCLAISSKVKKLRRNFLTFTPWLLLSKDHKTCSRAGGLSPIGFAACSPCFEVLRNCAHPASTLGCFGQQHAGAGSRLSV